MPRKPKEESWKPRQAIPEDRMSHSPYGHCAGCFGVKDGVYTHYPGTVEHPFTDHQAENYRLGREIDAIAEEV